MHLSLAAISRKNRISGSKSNLKISQNRRTLHSHSESLRFIPPIIGSWAADRFSKPWFDILLTCNSQFAYLAEIVEMARMNPKALLAQSKQKKRPSQFGLAAIITYLLVAILTVLALYTGYKYFLQTTTPPQVNN